MRDMPVRAPPSARRHDVRIEHSDQPLEVTLAGGSQERIDDTPLFMQVRVSVQALL
jgi:hypothetical protein